jgi:hypothetical protein
MNRASTPSPKKSRTHGGAHADLFANHAEGSDSMTLTPRGMLRTGQIPLSEETNLLRLLAEPAGWPCETRLAVRARELGFRPPAARRDGPPVHFVQMVSVTTGAGAHEGTLWSLPVRSDAKQGDATFIGEAAETWQRARSVMRDGLSHFIPAPGVLQPERLGAPSLLWGPFDDLLDGGSFGVAFLAVHVARLFDTFVPAPDLVATATLTPLDRKTWKLGTVLGLNAKIEVVIEAGLGIRRLLVARAQKEEAEEIVRTFAAERGPIDLEVVAADTPDDALAYFFGAPLEHLLEDQWKRDPNKRDAALRQIWNHTAHNARNIGQWAPVARTATLLKSGLTDRQDLRKAEIAERIARRHTGESAVRIEWDDALSELLESLDRWPRMEVVAHVIQSVTDSGDADWQADATRARELLADDRNLGPGDLKTLGALARLHASWWDDTEALSLLFRATEGWLDSPQPQEASYSLSALLRHAAAMRESLTDSEALRIESLYLRFTDLPDIPTHSHAFAIAAVACFFESRGRIDEAADALHKNRRPGAEPPANLYASCERIRARLDRAKQHDGAPYDFRGYAVQEHLAALDAALALGTDTASALDFLREHEHSKTDLARIARCTDSDFARAVQRRYPY